jgi:hypothetical protein
MDTVLISSTHYLRGSGAPKELTEHAGRVFCHPPRRAALADLIRTQIRNGPESLTEHTGATFEISGISRGDSQQLVPHAPIVFGGFLFEAQACYLQLFPQSDGLIDRWMAEGE